MTIHSEGGTLEPRGRVRAYYRPASNCQIPNLAGKWEAIFGRRSDGYFVEVGGYDGDNFSNTSCLADVGWRGLYIEPVPEFAERCRARHQNNHGVATIVAAVSDKAGTAELHLGDTLSTLNRERFEAYDRIEWAKPYSGGGSLSVETCTLDALLDRHAAPIGFDLLVIDVEGAEGRVLAGFTIERWRPKVLVIELEDDHPDFKADGQTAAAAQEIRAKLISAGYTEYYRDFINTIFVSKEADDALAEEVQYDAHGHPLSRVTIGLPVRNGEKTLRRTLDSILSQSFSDFTLVISDNCSTDATPSIIDGYASRFERLSVRRSSNVVPAMDNFRYLAEICDTEYFVWIADDDWWEPSFLEACVAILDRDPATQLAFTDYRRYYHFLDRYSRRSSHVSSASNDPELNFLTRLFDMVPCAVYGVFRAKVIQDVIRRYPEAFDFSDVLTTMAVAVKGAIAIVPSDLFRAGVRDERSVKRRSLDGGQIRYLRFLKEACLLALRSFGWVRFSALLPEIVLRMVLLRRHNLSVQAASFDPSSLLDRGQLSLVDGRPVVIDRSLNPKQ